MSFWQKWDKAVTRINLWKVGVFAGVVFLMMGFFGNQFEELYRKAVMICLECIGIG